VPSGRPDHRGRRALVVDDEEVVRDVCARLLERMGYAVRTARDGEQALALLRAEPGIELLLTDVVMPGIDGAALEREVRAHTRGATVVFMSGYADRDTVNGSGPSDGSLLLQKPFTPAELEETLEQALAAPSVRRAPLRAPSSPRP
jgi:two-component system, cell cycle sensor histidine kinase and response regulator CckA